MTEWAASEGWSVYTHASMSWETFDRRLQRCVDGNVQGHVFLVLGGKLTQ